MVNIEQALPFRGGSNADEVFDFNKSPDFHLNNVYNGISLTIFPKTGFLHVKTIRSLGSVTLKLKLRIEQSLLGVASLLSVALS
jgi:hypothetical protein